MTCEGNFQRSLKYLRFVLPDSGPLPGCMIEFVGGVNGYAARLIIQTGKVIEIAVALAYVLASWFAETRWWGSFVEEFKALGEVLADLTDDQRAQPQQEREKSSQGRHAGEQAAKSTSSWGEDARIKVTNQTNGFS